jgi:tetratricopeptide (TPR) repeat protein
MPRAPIAGTLWPAAALIVCGCAAQRPVLQNTLDQLDGNEVELTATPFFPQEDFLCGPAALATVLNSSGVEASYEAVTADVYLPKRRGSLQVELVAAMRRYGRIPYEIDPSLEALVAELRAGRPVLVLQNLGVKLVPLWHYAVVVGFSAQSANLVLRSGETRRLVVPAGSFFRSWRRGAFWGVVALRPDELPALADEGRYVETVAAVEAVGRTSVALEAYRTALGRWPGNALARLGLGNAHYAMGDLDNAARAYRELLAREPGNLIALNNLAQVLAERGCVLEAAALIDAALAQAEISAPLQAALTVTRTEIAVHPQARCER